jgi:iron complex outermembrane receptor protein
MFSFRSIRGRAALAAMSIPFLASAQAPDRSHDHERDDLDEVVVTATALRRSTLEVAQPTSILSGDDLVRDRATSIGEALASTAGVSATYFGPQASRPVIRGLTGERVQVSEDGAESLDVAALSADHAVTIDPLLADRVEVLRGPATLLYGNGAAGGLVNVLVRRVPEQAYANTVEGAAEMRGDTALGERAAAVRIDGGSAGWAFHGDAYRRETDDVGIAGYSLSRRARASGEFSDEEIAAGRGRLRDSASSLKGGALGVSRVGEEGFAGVAASRFETQYGIPGAEEGVSIDLQQTRFDFNSEWHPHGSWLDSARARVSFNRYEHAELEPGGDVGTQFDQHGLSARLTIEHAALAGWRGSFGAQYRDIDFSAVGEEAFVPGSVTRNLGLFAYEERAFGAVTLELGARLEQQEIAPADDLPGYDSARMSYSGGLVWRFAEGWNTALNVTSTTRHPTSTELFADGPHLAIQRFEIGDVSLRPERATTVDASLRHQGGTWAASFTVYRSDYADYIHTALTGDIEDGLPVAVYLQRDARFTGFEAEIDLPEWTLGGGTLATKLVADTVRAEFDEGDDLPQIPPLRVGAEARYSRGAWSTGVSAHRHAGQDRVADDELPTDGYTMLGADATWTLPWQGRRVLAYLRADNLLDEDARRHTSPLKERAPLPGRSFGAGVRLEF